MGSLTPIPLQVPLWRERLLDRSVKGYLWPAVSGYVQAALLDARRAPPVSEAGFRANTDLFPRDEFRSPPDL